MILQYAHHVLLSSFRTQVGLTDTPWFNIKQHFRPSPLDSPCARWNAGTFFAKYSHILSVYLGTRQRSIGPLRSFRCFAAMASVQHPGSSQRKNGPSQSLSLQWATGSVL